MNKQKTGELKYKILPSSFIARNNTLNQSVPELRASMHTISSSIIGRLQSDIMIGIVLNCLNLFSKYFFHSFARKFFDMTRTTRRDLLMALSTDSCMDAPGLKSRAGKQQTMLFTGFSRRFTMSFTHFVSDEVCAKKTWCFFRGGSGGTFPSICSLKAFHHVSFAVVAFIYL